MAIESAAPDTASAIPSDAFAAHLPTAGAAPGAGDLTPLLRERRIVVVVGAGGVGKTTVSATLALCGAILHGKKTLVLTIDPARRLADALGIGAIGHDIRQVPEELLRTVAARRGLVSDGAPGPMPGQKVGSLHAMMLDQKRAFDEVVFRYARDPAARERILNNPIYQQISARLAGSHEFAAMAKLYELARESDYELIVLDTPPTENALDFLDAPQRMSDAIDSPVIQWLSKSYQGTGSFSLKLVSLGGSLILRTIARFTGSEFLGNMAQFFVEFNQVLGGFRERSQAVFALMRRPDVAFVLCSSAEAPAVDEVLFFHERLRDSKLAIGGFVVNRLHPLALQQVTLPGPAELRSELLRRLPGYLPADLEHFGDALRINFDELQILAQSNAASVARINKELAKSADAASPCPVCTVPIFERDIFGADGLALVSRYLCS